ncbi:hypothetical protein M9H77_12426 [Catharanthus roseus]|uniref:Uncharacterized protein n=1 Tax=Catharanthus roseus TaxID=4058 RepID=A0ACC0BHG3_CATRO|nr:hypothetical protein M9H77_12426 [Catharanthus roseus]
MAQHRYHSILHPMRIIDKGGLTSLMLTLQHLPHTLKSVLGILLVDVELMLDLLLPNLDVLQSVNHSGPEIVLLLILRCLCPLVFRFLGLHIAPLLNCWAPPPFIPPVMASFNGVLLDYVQGRVAEFLGGITLRRKKNAPYKLTTKQIIPSKE